MCIQKVGETFRKGFPSSLLIAYIKLTVCINTEMIAPSDQNKTGLLVNINLPIPNLQWVRKTLTNSVAAITHQNGHQM